MPGRTPRKLSTLQKARVLQKRAEEARQFFARDHKPEDPASHTSQEAAAPEPAPGPEPAPEPEPAPGPEPAPEPEPEPAPEPEEPVSTDLIRMAGRTVRGIDWLWEGRVPVGKCTLLVGDPDAGKSFVTLDLAARVTRGRGVPPEGGPRQPGSVLLLSADDHIDDTILPRLQAAGADLGRIALLPKTIQPDGQGKERLLSLVSDLERLEQALAELGDCRLVIVDPISAYLRGVDTYNDVSVRQHLLKLSDLAERFGAAFLLVSHQRKAGAPTAMYRAIGSLAFTAVARVVLMVAADESVAGRRLLLPVKMTLQTAATGRAFAIEEGRVVWEPEPVPFTADELARLMRSGEATVDVVRETVEWLKDLFEERKRIPADEVLLRSRERKVSRAMLYTAKKQACVKAVRDGKERKWYWERILPWHQGMLPDDQEWEIAQQRARRK
jgi:KaiC/GvpD/RAD55 family RecA-like ATPase